MPRDDNTAVFELFIFLNSIHLKHNGHHSGLHRDAYSQTQGNPVLVCEFHRGLFPCSLSLAGGLHLKSKLCSLDHTTLWEDHRTVPRTIS